MPAPVRTPASRYNGAVDLLEQLGVEGSRVTAVAGSGGKTSLILSLAGALRARSRAVAVTTTTRMGAGEILEGAAVVQGEDPVALRAGMEDAFAAGRVAFLFSRVEGSKAVGIAPGVVDALAGPGRTLLVEADGSRRMPLKFPRPFEPVVPGSADRYVVVLGASALGAPAGEATVFNLEGAAGAVRTGDPLTPGRIAALLHDPAGPLRACPHGAAARIFVNQADAVDAGGLESLVRALGHPRVERIVAGSAGRPGAPCSLHTNRDHRVAALVLAAGASRRFGGPKLLAPVGGRPMAARAAQAAVEGGADDVIVVLGHEAARVREALAGVEGLHFALNERHAFGMSESIRVGLAAVSGFDAALVLPADLPDLPASLVRRVLDAYREGTAPLCFPDLGDRPGHPVVFRSELWPALAAVKGDEGGRSVVQNHRGRARIVDPGDPVSQRDVDTPGDLERTESGP